MTDTTVGALAAYAGQLSEAANIATAAAATQHAIIHGDSDSDIVTESGPIPTYAKQALLAGLKVDEALSNVAIQVAGAMTYSTIEKGLLGTVDGSFFSVPSNVPGEYLIMYKNVAGTAVEQDRLPSSEAVNEMLSNLRQDPPQKAIFSVSDEEGFSKFVLQPDGGFGSDQAYAGPERFSNNAFDIRESAPGVGFAVVDDGGYHAVFVGENQTSEDIDKLYSAIKGLNTKVADLGATAGIPMPSRAVVAHRGTAVGGIAPENSLDAYQLAARAGYVLVETDVLKTSDGAFVIMHDDTINRTCRNASDYSVVGTSIKVNETTLADLRSGYVLASDNPKFRRKIPTFDEFLSVCRDFGLHPVIELKNTSFSISDVSAIVTRAVEVLGADGFSVTGFNASHLDYVRTLQQSVRLYYIYGAVDSSVINHVAAMQPAVLYCDYNLFSASNIAEAKLKGVKVGAWTVPNAKFDSLLKMGLDEFATNTIAPKLSTQSVIFRNHSDTDFSSYATNGVVNNGVLALSPGQQMVLSLPAPLYVQFGSYYLSMDVQGTVNLVASRLSDSLLISGDEFSTYNAQAILVGESLSLVLTAGSSGCRVKDINLAIAKF